MALPTLQELSNSLNALSQKITLLETTVANLEKHNSEQGERIAALENKESGNLSGEIEEEISEVKEACGIFASGFEKLQSKLGKGEFIPEGNYFR